MKKVQHPTGGVVGELRVREGDHVLAGDILLRLDETLARVNQAVITKELDEPPLGNPVKRPSVTGPKVSPFRRICWRDKTIRKSGVSSAASGSCSKPGAMVVRVRNRN